MKCRLCEGVVSAKGLCRKCYNKKYQAENKDELKIKQKGYRFIYDKKNYLSNKKNRTKTIKIWKELNPEKVEKSKAKFRLKNPGYITKYSKTKYDTDVDYRISKILRTSILGALKYNRKSTRTTKLLGCTIQEFRQHIESQWLPGMSWDNHSINGWHIDHIIPKFKFDLSKPEEQQKCFHYTNQRPLWCTTEVALINGCNEIGNLNREKRIQIEV